MKLITLRDNTTLGGDPITAGLSILDGLMNLFGGGEGKGQYVNGRFVPGDINNRLQWIASRMQQYGVTEYDLDIKDLENIVYGEGVWQGKVDNYIISVYLDKKQNPQNYPKYKNAYGQNYGTADASLLNPNFNLSSILLIGAGIYLMSSLMSKKRK
ncbi:MAG: hypothetical protein GYA62_10010 [Bacteroidales bacterium]|nr:hypothetical protein [Bacteroidales bacterium]